MNEEYIDQIDTEVDNEIDENEVKADARRFILDAIENGDSPYDILDGLTTFFDGDPCELF